MSKGPASDADLARMIDGQKPLPYPDEPDGRRRLALIYIPSSLMMMYLFAQPLPGKARILTPTLLYRGKLISWNDCEVVDVAPDWERNCIAFKVRSQHFAIVNPLDAIERCDFAIEERMVDVPTEAPARQARAAWEHERAAVVSGLRIVCDKLGDNDWPQDAHLGDVMQTHLLDYLDEEEVDDDEDDCEVVFEQPGEPTPAKEEKYGMTCVMPADFLTVDYTFCKTDHTTGLPIGDTIICEKCRARYAPAEFPGGCPKCERALQREKRLADAIASPNTFVTGEPYPNVGADEEYCSGPQRCKCGGWIGRGVEKHAPQCADAQRELIDDNPSDPGRLMTPAQEREVAQAVERMTKGPTFADIMQLVENKGASFAPTYDANGAIRSVDLVAEKPAPSFGIGEGFTVKVAPKRHGLHGELNDGEIMRGGVIYTGQAAKDILASEKRFRRTECADCGGPIGQDGGPKDGWQLEDGRTVCQACCVGVRQH